MSWLSLPIRRDVDVVAVRSRMRALAAALALSPRVQARLLTAASELARWCTASADGQVGFGWNDVTRTPWVEFCTSEPLPPEIVDMMDRLSSSEMAIDRRAAADTHRALLRIKPNTAHSAEPESLRALLLRGDDATAVEMLREQNREMARLLSDLRAREEDLVAALESARAANEAAESALRLSELAKRKDEVLAIVSHDIRSPLSAARGALSILEQSLGDLTPYQKRLFTIAKRAGDNIVELVSNVLTSALLDADAGSYEPKPVDIAKVTAELVGTLEIPATQKALKISAQCEGPAYALAEPTWVQQVVSNLIMNAIKFTDRGGQIRVRVVLKDIEHVLLEVSDTGVGIPAEQREKVFQKLSKLRPGGTAGERGTGLGLYITKKLVDRMGGSIDFESVEGKGTTFRVRLPAARAEQLEQSVRRVSG